MVPLDDAVPGTVPPKDAITAALLARAKTATDLQRELSDLLGGVPDADPFATLGWRRPPAGALVLDALDEAADPQAVIADFIKPLQAASIVGAGPRLIVATRRPSRRRCPPTGLRSTWTIPSTESGGCRRLREQRPSAADDPASPTPYRGRPELARAVGTEVAAIAGPSFLIAQIAARTLANAPNCCTAEQVTADRHRWHDVGTAFDRDLARYRAQEGRVRDAAHTARLGAGSRATA